MINKPKKLLTEKEEIINTYDDTYKDTIKKCMAIQDILLVHTPKDKRFIKYNTEWLLEYIDIINKLDGTYNKHYSDRVIQTMINSLYNKIFKNRRNY